jgi:hypothetical protein
MKTGLIKKPKDFTNFTVVPNPILRDKNLSVGAVGLYCFLFSHTAEFTITIEFIIGAFKDGKSAIKSKIKELETAGYLLRERVKGDKGLFVGYNYELVLEPADQLSDNGLSGRTVYVQPENRPHTNRLQSNTNNNTSINTEITKEINTKDTAQVKKPAPAKFSQLVENAFAPYLDLFKGEKTLPKNESQKLTWKNTLVWFEKNDYDLREVYAAVKWARQDPFWGPNVLSLPALKNVRNSVRKIDNLMAKYKVAIKQDNKPKAMAYLKGVKEWFLKTNALGKVEVQAQTYNGDVINEFLIRQNVQFTDQDITDIYNYLKND